MSKVLTLEMLLEFKKRIEENYHHVEISEQKYERVLSILEKSPHVEKSLEESIAKKTLLYRDSYGLRLPAREIYGEDNTTNLSENGVNINETKIYISMVALSV